MFEHWAVVGLAADVAGAVRVTLQHTTRGERVVLRLARDPDDPHARGSTRTRAGALHAEHDTSSAREALAAVIADEARWSAMITRNFPHTLLFDAAVEPRRLEAALERASPEPVRAPMDGDLSALLADRRLVFGETVYAVESVQGSDEATGLLRDAARIVLVDETGARVSVSAAPVWSSPNAFVVVGPVALSLEGLSGSLRLSVARAVGALALVLALAVRSGFAPALVAPHDDVDRPLVIDVRSECHQQCSFCTVKLQRGPSDGGAEEVARWRETMRLARAQGVRSVQLDGIDPMRHSGIFELVRSARELGFERLVIAGPGRVLADRPTRDAVFDEGPASTSVLVAIYGVRAETHDAVTGAPGSFDEARAALDAIVRERGRESVVVGTVATARNVEEIGAIVADALERTDTVWMRMPYPRDDRERHARDGFARSAVRETDVVEHFARAIVAAPPHVQRRALAVLATAISHPCVLRRAAPMVGDALVDDVVAATSPRLHGVSSASARGGTHLHLAEGPAIVPCRHARTCVWAPRCSQAQLAAYVDRFGDDELRPG
ncbi:molybdopterin-based tungsten cofactor biosynthesis protein [Sandaracinus amylolyticus]|uniref:Molybdopterin-based tungsten cofactor biosynthesis protein n=1 Tax=Sandaracinus amylolyticus TaxID=927083 RepID=A0A0F6SDD0_9BACT|nr:molybdopterin-based tungsten cofactor biosynthesis protein [Sandaracinus amylolyticus]